MRLISLLIVLFLNVSAFAFPHGGSGVFIGSLTATQLNAAAAGNITSANTASALNAITDGYFYIDGTISTGTTVGTMSTTASAGSPTVTYAITGDTHSCWQMSGANLQPASLSGSCAPGSTPESITVTASATGYSGTPSVTVVAYAGQKKYISASGTDSGSCTSGSPCLTPNFALTGGHCGDFVIAQTSSSYSYANFRVNQPISCPGNDNIAWIKCATFANCSFSTISPSGTADILIGGNYWGVQGFALSSSTGACAAVTPFNYTATLTNGSTNIAVTNTLKAGDPVFFSYSGGGALPSPLVLTTKYYVLSAGLSGSNIEVATSPGGTAITIGSGQSGTQYVIPIVHHVTVANNQINSCGQNGVSLYQWLGGTGPSSYDYVNVIGNWVNNAAQASDEDYSGISCGALNNYDSGSGTHMYLAWNISANNIDGASSGHTDGEGIICVDTADLWSYSGKLVIENNLAVWNGGFGLETFEQSTGGATAAGTYLFRNNTAYDNMQDASRTGTTIFDLGFYSTSNANLQVVTAQYNIVADSRSTGANGNTLYAVIVATIAAVPGSVIDNDWWSGNSSSLNIQNYNQGNPYYYCQNGSQVTGGAPNSNVCSSTHVTTSPAFASPTQPSAPSCASATDIIACAATVISNFTPSASGISAYGGFTVNATCDANNTTAYIGNVSRALPASMNKCN